MGTYCQSWPLVRASIQAVQTARAIPEKGNFMFSPHGPNNPEKSTKVESEELKRLQKRYRYFVEQTSEGFYRLECETPISIHEPVERQVDLMYDTMYLSDCNEAFAM